MRDHVEHEVRYRADCQRESRRGNMLAYQIPHRDVGRYVIAENSNTKFKSQTIPSTSPKLLTLNESCWDLVLVLDLQGVIIPRRAGLSGSTVLLHLDLPILSEDNLGFMQQRLRECAYRPIPRGSKIPSPFTRSEWGRCLRGLGA